MFQLWHLTTVVFFAWMVHLYIPMQNLVGGGGLFSVGRCLYLGEFMLHPFVSKRYTLPIGHVMNDCFISEQINVFE